MRTALLATFASLAALSAGCEMFIPPPETRQSATASSDSATDQSADATAGDADGSASASSAEAESRPGAAEAHYAPSERPALDQSVDSTPAETETPSETVAAEAGVGVQGQSLEPGSVITEPARALFRAEQRIIFQNVERALQLYHAEHNAYPASMEEFNEKIIKPNGIQLPELPRGQQYIFDSENGKLMVERPKS